MSPAKKSEAAKPKTAAKAVSKTNKIAPSKVVKKIPVRKIENKETIKTAADSFRIEDIWGEEEKAERSGPESEDRFMERIKNKFSAGNEEDLKSKETKNIQIKDRPLNLYRKISVSFILLTVILLAVIFYFSFVKLDIKVIMKEESVSNNLVVDIYQGGENREGAISGLVKKTYFDFSKEYDATGKNVTGEEVTGRVKIINNYGSNQPLVATTRLQSADGKIFRIKDTVNVPANGFVEVDVYADQSIKENAISPTKFTIPGLWAGLQDKIYAENSQSMTYQEKVQKFIQQADIDNALEDAKNNLLAKAREQAGDDMKNNYKQILYKLDDNSIKSEISAKQGEEKDKFTVKLTADVIAVAFKTDEIEKLAKDKLNASLDSNQELIKFNQDQAVYTVNSVNADQGTAAVNVAFDGVVLPRGNSVINKEKLVGLTEEQLNNYLSNIPEISNFEIKFYPSFIKKVPNLADKISIETEK